MKKALTICLLLFGMIAVANTVNNDEEKKALLEAKKKAIYYEIRVDLIEGTITIEQAQRRWLKEVDKLRKEGAQ